MTNTLANSDQYYIETLLSILGKEDCSKTSARIRQAFGLEIEKEKASSKLETFSIVQMKAVKSAQYLISQANKNQASSNAAYKSFSKKIHGMKDALQKALKYANDPEIIKFLQHRAHRDEEVSPSVILASYEKLFGSMAKMGIELEMFLDDPNNAVGRPSLTEFYSYVYEVIRLYEELAKTKFTLLRHKESGDKNAGKYLPITQGHKFIYHAAQYANDLAKELNGTVEGYTDNNIYNACEAAQLRLKAERQPR
jgi:hypothetical protein